MTEEDFRENSQEWEADGGKPEDGEAEAANAEESSATADGGGGGDEGTQDEFDDTETNDMTQSQPDTQASDMPGVGEDTQAAPQAQQQ